VDWKLIKAAKYTKPWRKSEKNFAQYGVMLVNPQKHAHVKQALGQQFIDWILSPTGQSAIGDYKIAGERLFVASARP
jgi:tungstate transport system substrate-binding protein